MRVPSVGPEAGVRRLEVIPHPSCLAELLTFPLLLLVVLVRIVERACARVRSARQPRPEALADVDRQRKLVASLPFRIQAYVQCRAEAE